MGDISDGFVIAERLIQCERRLAEQEERWLAHELSEGAHASAFNAHGASPGPVEAAEETAEEIINNANDVAAEAIEGITDAGAAAVEDVTEAGEAATESTEEIAEAMSDAAESVIPEGEGEREPANVHFLHRRWGKAS